jgi:quercetin dioxygenase-like cupin family protein
MRISQIALGFGMAIALSTSAAAQHAGFAAPQGVLEQMVDGMPQDEKQHVRVLTATFKPGDKTVTHTHRFPVTVYVLEGTFLLELKGQGPIAAKAGEAIVEPPNVEMIGHNPSRTEPTKVVIFYVSKPGMPFLDPVH